MDTLIFLAVAGAGVTLVIWMLRQNHERRNEIADDIRAEVSERGWTVTAPSRTGPQEVVITADLGHGMRAIVRKDVTLNDAHTGGASVSFPNLTARVLIDPTTHTDVAVPRLRPGRALEMHITESGATVGSIVASIDTAATVAHELVRRNAVGRATPLP